jgi:hypothetical protein
VTRYLNRFICHIREEDLYVVQKLQHGSIDIDSFTVFSPNKIQGAFVAINWAIKTWKEDTGKAIKQRLTGNPYKNRVASDEFNLLAGAMPYLDLPDKQLSPAELDSLKVILTHIKESLISGNQQDYDHFLDWAAWICQQPDRKIGYMPFFVGAEGTGKGVIIVKLLLPLFGKCGLHATNFDSVTEKFNSAMEYKSLVVVDEGVGFLTP